MSALPFHAFPKIPRLKRDITVTEKIDGTNAQVYVRPVPTLGVSFADEFPFEPGYDTQVDGWLVRAGSRNRWLPVPGGPGADNHGFGQWVWAHAAKLVKDLGAGNHFGEWWGAGIQRRYGKECKYFSLFNTARWIPRVECTFTTPFLGVVPVLYVGPMVDTDEILEELRRHGSYAAPGFMAPEGIVVYHHASRQLFKRTLEKDEEPKGASE